MRSVTEDLALRARRSHRARSVPASAIVVTPPPPASCRCAQTAPQTSGLAGRPRRNGAMSSSRSALTAAPPMDGVQEKPWPRPPSLSVTVTSITRMSVTSAAHGRVSGMRMSLVSTASMTGSAPPGAPCLGSGMRGLLTLAAGRFSDDRCVTQLAAPCATCTPAEQSLSERRREDGGVVLLHPRGVGRPRDELRECGGGGGGQERVGCTHEEHPAVRNLLGP